MSRRASEDREVREQRRELVGTMLLTRVSYREMARLIGERLNLVISIGTIANDVAVLRARWGARMTADFGQHVAEQMAYYDGLLRAVTPKALQGDHNAVQDLLGVLDRRARLVGMDQPDKVLVGAVVQTEDVAAAWRDAPRELQVSRTEQILAILAEAGPPQLSPQPSPNGDAAIDV